MRMSIHNTKKTGMVTVFTYQKGKEYVSVCLELDIVKEGQDFSGLTREMIEAVKGYVQTVCKEELSDDLLNRPAPETYWKAYDRFLKAQEKNEAKHRMASLNTFPISNLCLA